MAKKVPAWTLQQLHNSMVEDLKKCRTVFEKINCLTICMQEIEQKGDEWRMIRKLEPGEVCLLDRARNYNPSDFIPELNNKWQ